MGGDSSFRSMALTTFRLSDASYSQDPLLFHCVRSLYCEKAKMSSWPQITSDERTLSVHEPRLTHFGAGSSCAPQVSGTVAWFEDSGSIARIAHAAALSPSRL